MNEIRFSPVAKRRLAVLVAASLALVISATGLCRAQPDGSSPILKKGLMPKFQAIKLLKVNGKVLGDSDKIMFGSPEFADWDGDGATDLILGYWAMWSLGERRGAGDGGKVRLFRNVGKADVPEYEDMGDLRCDTGLVRLKEA